jgi:hypothetical protein
VEEPTETETAGEMLVGENTDAGPPVISISSKASPNRSVLTSELIAAGSSRRKVKLSGRNPGAFVKLTVKLMEDPRVAGTSNSLKKLVSESVTVPGRVPVTLPAVIADPRDASDVKLVMETELFTIPSPSIKSNARVPEVPDNAAVPTDT